MIDAARWRKARAKAGCAQATTHKRLPRTESRARLENGHEEYRSCVDMLTNACLIVDVKDKRVGFEPGFEAAVGRQLTN